MHDTLVAQQHDAGAEAPSTVTLYMPIKYIHLLTWAGPALPRTAWA